MGFIKTFLKGLYAEQIEHNDVADFSTVHLEDYNIADVKVSSDEGNLIGIVDESGGGIIAYAIGRKHADLIQDALMLHKSLSKL